MLGKALSGKRHPSAAASGGDGGGTTNTRFLQELEALGSALSLGTNTSRRRSLPPPLPSTTIPDQSPLSAGRSHTKSNPKIQSFYSNNKNPSPSFWKKPFKALSHIRRRRLHCRFTLTVHSIDGLPPSLSATAVLVHWKRTTDSSSSAAATNPVRAIDGTVEFEETLSYRCSVYASRSGRGGSHNSVRYEPRHFLIWASLAGDAPGAADLGRHLVDLTRILPLTAEELEEEERTGRWSTSFRLSGRARGASLNVSFGFALVGEERSGGCGGEKRVMEILDARTGRMDREYSRGMLGGFLRAGDRSRSMEDDKVLHEVLPSLKQNVELLGSVEREFEHQKFEDDKKSGDFDGDSNLEFEAVSVMDNLLNVKPCTLPDSVKRNHKNCNISEFMVIEQGIEIATKHQLCESMMKEAKLEDLDEGGEVAVQNKVGIGTDEEIEMLSCHEDLALTESDILLGDPVMEYQDPALSSVSFCELESSNSLSKTAKNREELSYSEFKTNYRPRSMMCRSLSLDEEFTVTSEFLDMLGIEHSPLASSSDSDPDSPRVRLWKQFEKESIAAGDSVFGFDMEMEKGSLATSNVVFGLDTGAEKGSSWGGFSWDLDLSPVVLEAETELKVAAKGLMDSKLRAKMLADEETEELMREWGFDEKVFQSSPPRRSGGFGSPIHLPPEEPVELPPLGDGLGPFLQTKDGGFVRSMDPLLFKNAKNECSLIMQVSSPVVVPAEMGSGIMDILQHLALVGIEKLSIQAKKLMPLEDISGKMMQQIAWEACPDLETSERKEFWQHPTTEAESGIGQNDPGRKKSETLNGASSNSREMGTEYVLLENLVPSAMDKIEALSIEGLRIQSGMSDDEASYNTNLPYIDNMSALQGEGSKNRSLSLDAAASLQLLNVEDIGDDVDGLLGLSITLGEWMRLDSGIVDEEDQSSERTSKILAAHHARSVDILNGGWKTEKKGRRWGLLSNNFTVSLMVQLRNPLRDYEPVGTPMLALIQVERVFLPHNPKIYSTVSDKDNSEEGDGPENKTESSTKEEEDVIPQFKITDVHVAGLKTEPGKETLWGNPMQQQSGSRWMLATGMGKCNKHPFVKSKAVIKPSQVSTTLPGNSLWSITSCVMGAKWKELTALTSHIRNPNVILPNQAIRLR